MKWVTICFVGAFLTYSGKCDEVDDLLNSEGWKVGIWKRYLESKGYVTPDDKGKIQSSEVKIAIRKIKILYKFDDSVDISGIGAFMEKPRCGVPDLQGKSKYQRKRVRRYNLYAGWSKTSFTWIIKEYRSPTKGLSNDDQRNIIAKAFKAWNDQVPHLSFTETTSSSNADFKFSFVTLQHADCDFAFDGQGHDIAHAFFPKDGHIHFDDDEDFTDNPAAGVYLFAAAIHEIGHALGLDHSFKETSVMYPVYRQNNPNAKLDIDDIKAIQTLYAQGQSSSPCFDEDQKLCESYERLNYCYDFPDVMAEVCPVTCGSCH